MTHSHGYEFLGGSLEANVPIKVFNECLSLNVFLTYSLIFVMCPFTYLNVYFLT